MIYRTDRRGRRISQLGYGCMRFTGKGGSVDYAKAEEEVMLAVENGVNYFDTAYVYPGSEACLGRILDENGCRDKVSIATKLPQYIVRSVGAAEKYFAEELDRLRTDYIDYYLMHMFTDYAEWENLRSLGIEDWIREKKESGAIGSIGFSYHGETEMFLRILDSYDWDFCQIQYNYMDEHSQAGRRGLTASADRGIPVIVMEPLRGGKLARLPQKAARLLESCGSGCTPAEFGLRWLWDQPEVTCVLSGMNSVGMVKENVRVASEAHPGCFTDEERAVTEKIRSIIREREKVGCTGCRYCMPCPHGVDIPGIFHYYNLMYTDKKSAARFEFARNMGLRKESVFASRCVGCGRCERHCPQHIHIREELKKADRELLPPFYRLGVKAARKLMIRG